MRLVGKAFCIWHEGKNTYKATERPHDQMQTLHGEGRIVQLAIYIPFYVVVMKDLHRTALSLKLQWGAIPMALHS